MELKLLKLERELLLKTNMYLCEYNVKMFKNTGYPFNRFEYRNIMVPCGTLIAIDVMYAMCGGYREGLLTSNGH